MCETSKGIMQMAENAKEAELDQKKRRRKGGGNDPKTRGRDFPEYPEKEDDGEDR